METRDPVVKGVAYCLFHVPNLVRYGSKPAREISKHPELLEHILAHLRSYEEAKAYPPHQVFIGNLRPDDLNSFSQPWYANPFSNAQRYGPYGEIIPEDEFLGLLKLADEFDLVWLEEEFTREIGQKLARHRLIDYNDLKSLDGGMPLTRIEAKVNEGIALPLYLEGKRMVGCILRGHEEDANLNPNILLENLACKASGFWTLRYLVSGTDSAGAVDYVLNSGEEASGDRYQRGAGSLSKAMAQRAGCLNATGSDLKAYCCAPIHASVVAAGLVKSGLMQNVAVVGGGSLAKLGMKHQGHLKQNMPILEDVLAALAVLIGPDDGLNPRIRLDVVGKHHVGASDAPPSMMQVLVVEPLQNAGLKLTDVNKYALELHNPEITRPAGSGDPALNNYRTIAGIAAIRGVIKADQINDFVQEYGMLGFSPTQGHIAAAIPFLGHARDMMLTGKMGRAMFVAKGSIFLGKMANLSDGMSFLLERNGGDKVGCGR